MTYRFTDVAEQLGIGVKTLYDIIVNNNINVEIESDYMYIDENNLKEIKMILDEKNDVNLKIKTCKDRIMLIILDNYLLLIELNSKTYNDNDFVLVKKNHDIIIEKYCSKTTYIIGRVLKCNKF